MEFLMTLLSNEYFIWGVMALIIFGLTQIIKLPYKKLTDLIKNERCRKIANIFILLLPFALGVLGEFLYNTYYLHTAFTVITGLGYGMTSISLYAFVERFLGVKVENPYEETEEGQAVVNLIQDVAADGKIDNNDIDAVKAFREKIKK